MRLPAMIVALCVVSACAPPAQVSKNRPPAEVGVGFGTLGAGRLSALPGAEGSLVRDFMDLTFAMEAGAGLRCSAGSRGR